MVIDSAGKPLANAAVVLLKRDSVTVLSFALTNTSGRFTIATGTTLDAAQIRVTLLGYRTLYLRYAPQPGAVTLQMTREYRQLKEIVIRPPAVLTRRKDTLSYDVNSFAKPQDRTIGDILKNLPGITINTQGQISYQGRAINKFYIDGDDLLSNKYNLATTAIPADAVDKVQIFENHQPVNVLRGVAKSDQAALNLKLKNSAKLHLFGSGELAAGVPKALNGKADLMLFKDKIKLLNTLNYNSTGNDLNYEIADHTLEELLNTFDRPLARQLMSTRTTLEPPLDRNRWLFNKSALISANTLVKFSQTRSIRLNAYYHPGNFLQEYLSFRYYYPPGVVNQQLEQQNIRTQTHAWFTSLYYQDNAAKVFLDNKLDVQIDRQYDITALLTEAGNYNQQYNSLKLNINNALRIVKPFSGHLIGEITSQTGFINAPENLNINPGIYPELLNDSVPYINSRQQAGKKAFYTRNRFSLRSSAGRFQQGYDVHFDLRHVDIDSKIYTTQATGIVTELPVSFQNNTGWTDMKAGAQGNYTYQLTQFSFTTTLPVDFRRINFTDQSIASEASTQTYTLFNPSASFKWMPGNQHTIDLRAGRSTDFGNAEDLLPGQLIANYRTIYNNNRIINKRENIAVNASYAYRNPINIFFFTTGLTYNTISNNTISRVLISNDGLTQITRSPDNNGADRLMLLANVSKYLFDIKSTIRGGANLVLAHQDQIQNDLRLRATTKSINLSAEIDSKISERYNFNYKADYFQAYSRTNAANAESGGAVTRQVDQRLGITYYLQRALYLQTSGQLLNIHADQISSKVFFNDIKLSWAINHSKTDLAFSVFNIFNNRHYETQSVDFTSYQLLRYKLRPRTILIDIRFLL
ncbi:hypothetical protein [Mucilaginibacter sp.]